MATYDVTSDEGLCCVEQLAYASGVLGVVWQERGTAARLSEAAWHRSIARVAISGPEASASWRSWFARGYAGARRRVVRFGDRQATRAS